MHKQPGHAGVRGAATERFRAWPPTPKADTAATCHAALKARLDAQAQAVTSARHSGLGGVHFQTPELGQLRGRMSDSLGMGRDIALREALKVLAVEGLVTMKVGRGAYVTEMSRDDVAQVYRLLSLLESDAAAQVASEATDAEIAELQALHARLEKQTRQRDAFFAANEAFHLRLLALARNRWREQIVADLRKVMKLNRHHSLFKRGRLAESLSEHRALMQAIAARDAALAARLMREHFQSGLDAAA